MANKDDNFDFDTESEGKIKFDLVGFFKNLTKKQKETILMIVIGVVALIVIVLVGLLVFNGNDIITSLGGGSNNGGGSTDFAPPTGVDSDEIKEMTISAEPNKTVYYVGENIDLSGLVVYIRLNRGSGVYDYYDDRLDEFVVSGFDSSAPSDHQVVTVKYKENSVSFVVKIKEMPVASPSVQSITINPLPKTEYKVGGSFIARTAKIVATFSDGSTQEIALNRSHLSNWAEAIQTPGTHEIKVVYFDGNGGYAETTFTITVTE
jgi:hypothetical protein